MVEEEMEASPPTIAMESQAKRIYGRSFKMTEHMFALAILFRRLTELTRVNQS
jgi:hypothetical protein